MFADAVICMSIAIYFEARQESFYGQMLIANTIQNRVESTHYPKTHCDVVMQRNQFSFLNGVTKKNPLEIKDYTAFISTLAAADYYYKYKPKYFNGCHYATIATSNSWTMSFDMVFATMGHSFYEGGC